MTPDLPRLRFAWLITIVFAIALGVVAFVVYRETLSPLDNFQDGTAFLYTRPNGGTGLAAIAVLSIAFGLWLFLRSSWQDPDARRVARIYSACALGLGMFFSVVAVPVFLRDSENLVVLSEAGIGRYEKGNAYTLPWSSLHHLEVSCFRGYRGQPDPILTLRLPNGGVGPDVLAILPVRGTRQEARAAFEKVRERFQTPIIWASAIDEMSFREGDRFFARCANMLVDAFPVGSRRALLEMLSNGTQLREQTLTSYRSGR